MHRDLSPAEIENCRLIAGVQKVFLVDKYVEVRRTST